MVLKEIEGWIITQDHISDQEYNQFSRIGYGSISEREIEIDANILIGRSITVTTNLNPKWIKDPVPFEIYDDDDVLYFSGVITKRWIFEKDYGWHPLYFGEVDAGATYLKALQNGKMEIIYG